MTPAEIPFSIELLKIKEPRPPFQMVSLREVAAELGGEGCGATLRGVKYGGRGSSPLQDFPELAKPPPGNQLLCVWWWWGNLNYLQGSLITQCL